MGSAFPETTAAREALKKCISPAWVSPESSAPDDGASRFAPGHHVLTTDRRSLAVQRFGRIRPIELAQATRTERFAAVHARASRENLRGPATPKADIHTRSRSDTTSSPGSFHWGKTQYPS